jgi:hypothetical protein
MAALTRYLASIHHVSESRVQKFLQPVQTQEDQAESRTNEPLQFFLPPSHPTPTPPAKDTPNYHK